uniref:Uncharacterized protein n=1 Tax=viral metagenome TaxID=1070528 RepID=A0A6C0D2N5_9ZZZZ
MEYDNDYQMQNENDYLDNDSFHQEDSFYQEDDLDLGFEPAYPMSDTASSIISKPRGKNKNKDSYESADKNYHKLVRQVNGKKVEIVVYTSPICPGTSIRDAVSGIRYREYLVGSLNEHQFFKVKFATGEMGQDSGFCFFDSPEQYERHMHATISTDVKNNWADKCASIRKRFT